LPRERQNAAADQIGLVPCWNRDNGDRMPLAAVARDDFKWHRPPSELVSSVLKRIIRMFRGRMVGAWRVTALSPPDVMSSAM
jgi:hypothetical protein